MDQTKDKITENQSYIKFREYIAYAFGGVGITALFGLIGSYFLVYMTNVAFLDIAVISTIIAVSKLLDGISDIIIGNIIDNTNSKLGKARPWLLRMALPMAVSMMLLFWVPPQFPDAVKYIYVFLMYNLTSTVFYTFMQISHFSMVSLLSPDRNEQGILGNIVGLATMVSGLVGNVLFVKLLLVFTSVPGEQNTQRAYSVSLLIYCVLMVVSVLVMVFFTRERVTDVGKKPGGERLGLRELISEFAVIIKDKYWLVMIIIRLITTIGAAFFIVGASYYALYVLNDMSKMGFLMASNLVPSIIIMLITPFLMKRINKRKMFIAGMVVSMIGTASLGLFGTTVPAVVGSLMVCSTGAGLFSAVIYGIIADIVTYTKMTTGRFVAGVGNAGVSAVRKLGQGLNNVIFGFVLSLAGFDATLKVQPDSVVTAIRFLYSWAPFIGFAISLILFVAFYDLDKKFDSIKAEYDKANEE